MFGQRTCTGVDIPCVSPPPPSMLAEAADVHRVVHMAHQGILGKDIRGHLGYCVHAHLFAIRVRISTSNNQPKLLGHLIAFPRRGNSSYSSEALLDPPEVLCSSWESSLHLPSFLL